MRGPAGARGCVLAALTAAAIALAACGDLLQEPDTGLAKLPVRLESVSGNGQTGIPGAALAEPVRVRVLGPDDQASSRLWVEWTVLEGSGEAVPRNTFSDADGIAETTWILGPEGGPQRMRAFVHMGIPMEFEATAVTP